jgi:hypothetical protein
MLDKFEIGTIVGYVAKGDDQAQQPASSGGQNSTQSGVKCMIHVLVFFWGVINHGHGLGGVGLQTFRTPR